MVVQNEKSTVIVVDDDAAARESVMALASTHGLKTKGYSSAEEFLRAYDPLEKGCLVVDVRMEPMSGLQLLQQLASRGSSLPVVVITGYGDIPLAVQAMQLGAVTFLEKPCQVEELWQGIQLALAREEQQHNVRAQRAEAESRLASLTEDELMVFRRLLAGDPNKRIALDMSLGLRTIELRRSSVMRKMQANSLQDLVRMAILIGELQVESSSAPPDEIRAS